MKKRSGKCAVPAEIADQWRAGGEGRAALEQEFERCGFDKACPGSTASISGLHI